MPIRICARTGCGRRVRGPGDYCGDPECWASMDRGNKDGFVAYMEYHPNYLKAIFGSITSEQAWDQVKEI